MDELQRKNGELINIYNTLNGETIHVNMEYMRLTNVNRELTSELDEKETVTDTELEDLKHFLNTCMIDLLKLQETNILQELNQG